MQDRRCGDCIAGRYKFIREGAEAKVYSARLLGFDAIIKERVKKSYRIEPIDIALRESRTRNEAHVLYEAGRLELNVPRLLAIGRFCVYMERLEGKLLRDIDQRPGQFGEVGRELAILHESGIAHGDFTPANIMKVGKRFFIIDFGLSEITKGVEEKAIDLLLMKRSVDPRCYAAFARSYARHSKNARGILAKLDGIEERGRYKVRSVA
ncbi:MAG: Kae1-associated serine/threonine protein kinase [Candidatus Micrarchaeota archaeon]|nr:Kae1-associated serine/threonine protein kinase [Candidatus Micrarchaeota archaeon]MDE1847787.1 Kae1-associated serine/threonine protein kinase [Candidatus Micrarchaeota archaeon]MDE1864225.1 Kae1-associated serine/threonine protein kinase [Candidatus Micrarchaeota archaeon]